MPSPFPPPIPPKCPPRAIYRFSPSPDMARAPPVYCPPPPFRYHSRAIRLLDQLASDIPIEPFMSSVWGCLLRNASVRLHALNYINLRFPTAPGPLGSPSPAAAAGTPNANTGGGTSGVTAAGGSSGAGGGCGAGPSGAGTSSTPGGDAGERLPVSRRAFCPDAQGAVLRSLIVALQQGDSLVRRTALELLVTHFPLPAGPPTAEERPIGAMGRMMDAAGLGMLSPTRDTAASGGKSRAPPQTPAANGSRLTKLNGDNEQLFSNEDFTTLLRVALTLLPLCEWSLSRRVLFWVFRSPPPHFSSGINLALPPDAAPLLLGALRQLFTCAAAPPPPAAAANDEYDDPLAPRAEAAPLSPSPFRTLVHVLDVPVSRRGKGLWKGVEGCVWRARSRRREGMGLGVGAAEGGVSREWFACVRAAGVPSRRQGAGAVCICRITAALPFSSFSRPHSLQYPLPPGARLAARSTPCPYPS
jgi:hypothetical protein